MTLNLIFITVTIKKRRKTTEEYLHEENIARIYEENKLKHSEILLRNYF
ncbi:YrzI family small protein [Heyndrickxia camelliae]|uniref:YrzI family protein n=1 Tax=Heyndrickxia camelliae TaxID=1707093 RepID=A0A2N3LKL6_9BACI|nr:YrzI family small protein [Heyndrickxia camelliae]PKR85160.1 YrzI family protein [Heyndrickxia camelliae]